MNNHDNDNDKVLVCDLDGTLLSCNSFTHFVRYLFIHKPTLFFSILKRVARRKLRLSSHASTKQHILRLAAPKLSQEEIDGFAASLLQRYGRPEVRTLIDREREKGCRVLLATAAPALYAKAIARQAGFEGCVATEAGGAENFRQEKLRRVEEWLDKDGGTLAAIVTDHHDDLALIRRAARSNVAAWLVRPSAETRRAAAPFKPQIL